MGSRRWSSRAVGFNFQSPLIRAVRSCPELRLYKRSTHSLDHPILYRRAPSGHKLRERRERATSHQEPNSLRRGAPLVRKEDRGDLVVQNKRPWAREFFTGGRSSIRRRGFAARVAGGTPSTIRGNQSLPEFMVSLSLFSTESSSPLGTIA
jgi:hypothetical protein